MKPVFLLLASVAVSAAQNAVPLAPVIPHANPEAPAKVADKVEPTLVVGSSVTPDALAKGEWIQGEAPKAWEPGKVYLLECWATWCGPCIAAIPHVNELSKKYGDKGLRVFGMNVSERNGKEPVVSFVKNKGDGMSYPVSYNPKGSDFDTQWMVAAAVSGIPHTFVIKDGKIILMCHPMKLTDEIIEGLLKGGEDQTAALGKLTDDKQKQEKLYAAMRTFNEATRKKDVPAMEKSLAELKTLDPENKILITYDLTLLASKGDWAALEAAVMAMPEGPTRPVQLFTVARIATSEDAAPASLMKALASRMAAATESPKIGPGECMMLARLQWRAGDKPAALASAEKGVAAAHSEDYQKMKVSPVAPECFLAALKEGKLLNDKELAEAVRIAPRTVTPAAPPAGN
ncbi:MAG: TlpA disulfide reductase family protein [Luteolibacter sp.]